MYGISRSTARATSLSSMLISRRIASVGSISIRMERGFRCSVRSLASCCERSSGDVGVMAITESSPRIFDDDKLLIHQVETLRPGEGQGDLRYCYALPLQLHPTDLTLQVPPFQREQRRQAERPLSSPVPGAHALAGVGAQ